MKKEARPGSALEALIWQTRAFLDIARPAQHELMIRSVLQSVRKPSIWSKNDPASLLDYMEVLRIELKAISAFLADIDQNRGDLAQKPDENGPNWNKTLFRLMSIFQYKSYKGWKRLLKELTHFALSSNANCSLGADIDLLEVYLQLTGMVNACADLVE